MLKSIKNQSLFREQGLIDGIWCGSDSNENLSVLNPASGEVLGKIPNMGTSETKRAIYAAKNTTGGF